MKDPRSASLTATFFCLLAAFAAAPAPAQQPPVRLDERLPIDPQVTVGRLPNGVRYYIRVNHEPQKRAELRLAVRVGSVLEEEPEQGIAHFVEHMAFNGTKHFEKQELVSYLERVGMRLGPDLNAYTSFDETVYMLRIPTDSAEIVATAFQVLEDWAHGQVFDPQEIQKERGVVIEEWRTGRGASARMRDKQFPVLLKGSRYAERLPIGKREILESFSPDVPVRFYRTWYRPDLMAVVAVGDFEKATIEKLIIEHFSRLPSPPTPTDRPVFTVPDHDETLVAIATDPEATASAVSIYYKLPPRDRSTVGAYRRLLVERLYHAMLNQRFFELTQKPDPPFVGAFSGSGRFMGEKDVYLLAARVRDDRILEGLDALLTEAERVARHGFTPTELEREKRKLLRNMEQAYAEREKTHSAQHAAEYVAHFTEGEPIPGIAYEYELSQKLVPGISLQEVNALAQEWITERNRVILVSAPEKEGVRAPTEAEILATFPAVAARHIAPYEDVLATAPLVNTPPRPASIVEERTIDAIGARVWRLANGVRVILKPTDFKDDEILLDAWSPGGTSLAADEDFISAQNATSVVGVSGVGEFSLVELGKLLAGKAVRVTPRIGSLEEGITGSTSPRDAETMFQLVYLYFTAPRRDSAAFASFKARMQAVLANRSANPELVFQDTVLVTMANYHPRVRPLTPELYQATDLDKALAFYRDRFADASDFTFVLVGRFDPDSLKPLVLTYLGGLPSIGRTESWRDVGIDPPRGVVHKTVYKGLEEKGRTEIHFAGPFQWTRENRYALRSLGDLLRTRLREVLREDLGGTYGVSVSVSFSRDPDQEYAVRIVFGADPGRLEELSAALLQEIERLKGEGPSAADVAKVKEIQRREWETSLRQNTYWLSQLLFASRHGLDPVEETVHFHHLLDTLTPELLRGAAVRYLRPDNYARFFLYPEKK